MKYLSLIALSGLVAGCSSVSSFTDTTTIINYDNYKSVKALEIPSDLDQPVFDKTYVTDNIDIVNVQATSDRVPLVDESLINIKPDTLKVAKKEDGLGLEIDSAEKDVWTNTLNALKAMGMTVNSSNKLSSIVNVRDRSHVADPGSALGALLNRTIGRVNEGPKYQVMIKQNVVTFKNEDGIALNDEEHERLLVRFKKELAKLK